jgi:sulfur carrier protein
MKIQLNGNSKHFDNVVTAAQLVEHLGLQGKRIAMEVNQEIVPRSSYESFQLNENDRVEIINAVGGG